MGLQRKARPRVCHKHSLMPSSHHRMSSASGRTSNSICSAGYKCPPVASPLRCPCECADFAGIFAWAPTTQAGKLLRLYHPIRRS